MKLALVLFFAACGSAAAPPVAHVEPPAASNPTIPEPRYAAADLAADASFGTNGRLRFDDVIVDSMAMFEDDSFVLLTTPNYRDEKLPADTKLVRYTADGVVDRTWGTDGALRIPAIWGGSVQIDDQGRIVIVTDSEETVDIGKRTIRSILRLLPTGAPDLSFGEHGRVTLPPDPTDRWAYLRVFLQHDGSFILITGRWHTKQYELDARRMSASGGVAAAATRISVGPNVRAQVFAQRPDDSFVVGGANVNTPREEPYAFIAALRPDFSLEYVSALLRTPKIFKTDALALDSRGRIYLGAMELRPGLRGPIVIARYSANGELDETWATAGTWTDTSNSDIYQFLPVVDGTMWAVTVDQDHDFEKQEPHTVLVHFDEHGRVVTTAPGLGENWSGTAWVDRRGRVLVLGGYTDYKLHEDDQTPPRTSIIERFSPPKSL